MAKFDDSRALGGIAHACEECMNEEIARARKRRAALAAADAQTVAAAVATGPSRVPRSPEDTVKLKGSRHQVLDEADKQLAAGIAKYGDELKDLVALYKVDPDGLDKKLEGMFSAEEAAMVLWLVREAVRKPSLLGA